MGSIELPFNKVERILEMNTLPHQRQLVKRGHYLLPFVCLLPAASMYSLLGKTVISGPSPFSLYLCCGRLHRPIAITVCHNHVFVQAGGAGCSDEKKRFMGTFAASESIHRFLDVIRKWIILTCQNKFKTLDIKRRSTAFVGGPPG